MKVIFSWCALCLQGVETATRTDESGVYSFAPCGHTARFYKDEYRALGRDR